MYSDIVKAVTTLVAWNAILRVDEGGQPCAPEILRRLRYGAGPAGLRFIGLDCNCVACALFSVETPESRIPWQPMSVN